MLNKILKEVIKAPRTVIQTTAEEAMKIVLWEDDDEESE